MKIGMSRYMVGLEIKRADKSSITQKSTIWLLQTHFLRNVTPIPPLTPVADIDPD